MRFDHDYKDLANAITPHPGWREDGTVELMAAYQILDTLPLINIDGVTMDYPQAMRALKPVQK